MLSWAYHPRPLPLAVPAATLHMAAMRGMEVVVLRPDGFALPPAVMDKARRAAAESGGSVRESTDRTEAINGAHVLYIKEWAYTDRYGDEAADAQARGALKNWQCDDSWFAGAQADCHLMHCLPVRRNVAIADAVLDGRRSAVQRQGYNRLPAQMAVLYRLLKQVE